MLFNKSALLVLGTAALAVALPTTPSAKYALDPASDLLRRTSEEPSAGQIIDPAVNAVKLVSASTGSTTPEDDLARRSNCDAPGSDEHQGFAPC
ncbi:hypothetical protein HYDPIDRAFT_108161 [Hydnomerulius pinastri MD-312]|nr:hypothetical protein HYDPIDRAFT_108161 [Hydnomerulius pinastri MD-312]